jgi:FAD/FMN-containing dehydrogenase
MPIDEDTGGVVGGPALREVAAFPGARVERDDPRYPTMVHGLNARFVGHPRYVDVCGSTRQVVDSVQTAVKADMRITARCGGHCYENFVGDNRDGVIIDLSPMNGVYKAGDGIYCIEGGATLWNVYSQLYREYGVTLPGGSCYSVGVGGHVTGGGYGLLSRLYGLTVDYLDAVEVVHVDEDRRAQVRVVSAGSPDPGELDLLWGHQGGGGGNFGIVTKFWFRGIPAAPAQAWVASQTWDWADLDPDSFADLLGRYGRFLRAHSDPGSPWAGLFSLLHLFQNAPGGPQINLTTQYVGDEPALIEEFVQQMANGLNPRTDAPARIGLHEVLLPPDPVTEMPWLFATAKFNGSGPYQRAKYKSAYMVDTFPESQIAAMWKYLAAPKHPNARALLQIDSYGCQINTRPPDATPIPQRSSVMKLQYQTYWADADEDPQNLAWISDFYSEMYGERGPWPDGVMDGCYVNYPDVDLKEWPYLYYKENYPRLQRVKARWDPHDIFHHAQSIVTG